MTIIRQYVKLFELDGITLKFEEEVYEYIVDKAVEFHLGGARLRSICEAIMTDMMFEIPVAGTQRGDCHQSIRGGEVEPGASQKLRA